MDRPDLDIRSWTRADWAVALAIVALLALALVTAGDQPYDLGSRWR
jgi:hypothetical protein